MSNSELFSTAVDSPPEIAVVLAPVGGELSKPNTTVVFTPPESEQEATALNVLATEPQPIGEDVTVLQLPLSPSLTPVEAFASVGKVLHKSPEPPVTDSACPIELEEKSDDASADLCQPTDEVSGTIVDDPSEVIESELLEQADKQLEQDEELPMTYTVPDWLNGPPQMIACADKEYLSTKPGQSSENYLRGCLWSPDGSCILTNSRDNALRLFNLPQALLEPSENEENKIEEMRSVLVMQENELVYDHAWHPSMNSNDPTTCCFASTVRRNPIRLWDAFTGTVRAHYRPINHLGELVAAFSLAFSADGLRLYAGFNRFMHVFDVSRPGRSSMRRPRLGKKSAQGGILSCIGVPRETDRQLYATGSYNGTVALWSEPGHALSVVEACRAGVTQVMFSRCFAKNTGAPWFLAAGGRMDSRIWLWDARQMAQPLVVLHRRVENHQRFQFDIDRSGRYLFTGSQTGVVCMYDLQECLKPSDTGLQCLTTPTATWRAHADCTHGLSVHPSLAVVATSSGQRRIPGPRCFAKRPALDAGHSELSSMSESDSDAEVVQLTDEEACRMATASEGHDSPSSRRGLPLADRLSQLPRENRLALWAFPSKVVEA